MTLGLLDSQWPPVLLFAGLGLYGPPWFAVVNAAIWYSIAFAARKWG